jgi:2-hydroxychromene-2-carboxylate isomerase
LRTARDRRAAPVRRSSSTSDPLSYLLAERVERTLGDVDWIPVAGMSVGDASAAAISALSEHAERTAAALRLPLVWPDRFPAAVPRALRAAPHAAEIGAGARFALAASRLAFCGGLDLEDPEILAEAAAAAGIPLDACLAAAGDCMRDDPLRATAIGLRVRGVRQLPAIRVRKRLFGGKHGLVAASATLRAPAAYGSPLAPVG